MKSAISTALAMFFLAGCVGAAKGASTAVLTHHYDNYRTGWNQTETTLTPQNVGSPQFGILAATLLDAQVDAQPLVMPNQTITGGANPGTYDVVYVATEANTVYAINAANGQVLTSMNLGAAVPWPLGCVNNAATVGITSTPVIDKINGTLDLIAYTLVGGVPTYMLHALRLGDLRDKIGPVTVAASNRLSDGTAYNFNAQYQRQRPALLNANGAIYAGFGSFCDFSAGNSRGWLLAWNASNLTPFAANRLNNTLPGSASPNDFFLSSIWMSGSGPAADLFGDIYFATGNSDFSGTTYNPVTNISNTVAKVSPDLTQLLSKFTPRPYTSGNANIVPVVANGKVFVAAYGTLVIFGLRSGGTAPKLLKAIPSTQTAGLSEPPANAASHEITGTLLEIKGSALSIKTRAGNTVMIDATGAAQAGRSAVLGIGKAFSVQGTYDANGKLLATIIVRAKPSAGSWPRDR
jgi:hypothetical protein